VSDLRAMDMALGGQGAPIVPMGEKLLLGDYAFFLNIGGIANISYNHPDQYIAFDVCPANRVLNMLAQKVDKPYDDGGQLAAAGKVDNNLLQLLNDLEYYRLPWPKSLANDFGTDVVAPLINNAGLKTADALRTMAEHIAMQVGQSLQQVLTQHAIGANNKLLVTGGGAHNALLVKRLQAVLEPLGIVVVVPDSNMIDYKEALAMALIGVLRWREENNVLSSVTGATRSSIGGAVWIGQEA
jgi:anhydro-N-acetylmuramic acid kinase